MWSGFGHSHILPLTETAVLLHVLVRICHLDALPPYSVIFTLVSLAVVTMQTQN